MNNDLLWNVLLAHRGHNVSIVSYGDVDDPDDVCLECEDCGTVVLDAEIYTLCARSMDGSFTAFAYEDDGVTIVDEAMYDTAKEAIEFAKSHNWDEVVNDITGQVIYRR